MAANAAAFITALGLTQVDVFGFSLGGFVAQALAAVKPSLFRRLRRFQLVPQSMKIGLDSGTLYVLYLFL